MRKRIEPRAIRGAFAALAFVCASADALPPLAPKHLLEDPAGLKAAFEARIGRPVNVLRFTLGQHYSDTLVQSVSASDEFDRYEATPGQTLDEGKPQKAGSVDCTKKIPFAAPSIGDAGSASASTTFGDLPPSSSETFFRLPAAACTIILPTSGGSSNRSRKG